MLGPIVRTSLAHPRIVTAASVLVALMGLMSLFDARFDVFPDFAPPLVLVQTEAPGLDAQQVEALVTRPLESVLAGTGNVETLRSTSSQGLSAIQVVFGRGGDPYRQRQVVTERLSEARDLLPDFVAAPQLSPLSSSMEYLLHFGLTSDTLSPMELRDVARWTLKPQIMAVPGIAQTQLFGGESREREVRVDPFRLMAADLTLDDVARAVQRATPLVGGGYLETPSQRIVLQSQRPASSPEDLAQAVITVRGGVPITLGEVATIRDTAVPRFGDAMIGGRPGILVETSTQYGANTLDVTRALEDRLEALTPALAQQGVNYHPALLRPASFIETAISKLRNSLLIGALLVVVLLLVSLRDWRAAMVSFSAIPLSLLATVWILHTFGFSLNTMSLGGLVVALGVVVDDAVIDVENITRRRRAAAASTDIRALFVSASLEVRQPVFYATAAVAVAFIPIFMLSGIQGAFFRPLSIAFLLAVGLSLLVAMSATPALCALAMRRHVPSEEARFLKTCKRWQRSSIERLSARPLGVLALLIASGVAGAVLLPLLGARLLPDFREDYLIAHSALRPGVALAENSRIGQRIAERLAALPGVKSVAEQIGRAENGQDPDTPNKSEFEIQIDRSQGYSTREIEDAVLEVFEDYPQQIVEVYSVLAERIGETLAGESAPFFVNVFGPDLELDDQVAEAIASVLRQLPDSGNVRLKVPPRQTELSIRLRPQALAAHGVQAAEALETVQAAFQGRWVAQIDEADRSIPVTLRLSGSPASPESLAGLMIRSVSGVSVPLKQIAELTPVSARSQISHEGGLRRQLVLANPTTADLRGFAARAREAIADQVVLPAGVYLSYGGGAEAEAEARRELLVHSAVALVLIVLLLALAFGDLRHVLLVLAALPSTLIGGVAAIGMVGATLTLGAMVGFVALFGIAARNTILLISHYDHLVQVEGCDWNLATALRGAEERLTPVLLTALLTALALLPVAVQMNQPGHEIEGPMAVVILGGLVSSTLVSLLLVPPLAARWLRPSSGSAASAAEQGLR